MNDVCRDDKRPGVTSFLPGNLGRYSFARQVCLSDAQGQIWRFPQIFTILAQKSNREQFM